MSTNCTDCELCHNTTSGLCNLQSFGPELTGSHGGEEWAPVQAETLKTSYWQIFNIMSSKSECCS